MSSLERGVRLSSSTSGSEGTHSLRNLARLVSRRSAWRAWVTFFLFAMAVVVGLDAVTMHFRSRLQAIDMGRWRFPQWLETKERYHARVDTAPPSLLFLGDSSVAYGIRPSLVDQRAFSFARQALRTCELEELDVKLAWQLNGKPKAVVMGFLWFAFLDLDPDDSSALSSRPSLSQITSHFYDRPQLGQQFLPGLHLASQAVGAKLDDLRTRRRNFFVVRPDGSVEVPDGKPPSRSVATPGQLAETRIGWFTPGRLEHLRSFNQLWHARNVPMYFVFMPLHPGFRAIYDQKLGTDHLRWREAMTKLFEGQVIDMENTLQDPRYFSDAMHLNREGAACFSVMLREKLLAFPLGFPLEPARTGHGFPGKPGTAP